jgi:hypothetical protein
MLREWRIVIVAGIIYVAELERLNALEAPGRVTRIRKPAEKSSGSPEA